MSGGELSIFPILYEFIRQQIASLVVLIDAIDLNLHPSTAQFFVRKFPKITQSCQWIFTAHSEAVADIIGNNRIYRLPGGVLCL